MAGIYVHIPFCASRCIYCAFYSTTQSDKRQRYVDALCREAKMRKGKSEAEDNDLISTVYLGGGTPSQLSVVQLQQVLSAIYNIYKVEQGAEITIECNPDDITAELAEALPAMGVNRVSMGAQTFSDARLRFLRRRHSGAQVSEAVDRLRLAGIANISVDLMYGFPGETLSDWQRDIDAALALQVEHLSAYCLTIEEGTPLYRLIMENSHFTMDEELERQMYYTLIDRLQAAGYEHYEISNFARPGRRSRHNSSYWTNVPYIGLGAAAHSYDGRIRRWNMASLDDYILGIENGKSVFESELLTPRDRYNDRVMLSLRTYEGLNLEHLTASERSYLLPLAQKYIAQGLLIMADAHIRLSRKGLFVSDMVVSDLMWV